MERFCRPSAQQAVPPQASVLELTRTTCSLHNCGLIFLYSETAIKITLRKITCIIEGKLQNTGFETALSSKREYLIQSHGVNICVKVSVCCVINQQVRMVNPEIFMTATLLK